MYLTLRKTGNVLVIDVIGDVVGGDSIRLREAFEKALLQRQRCDALIINLEKAGLMDSFGLRALLVLHSELWYCPRPMKAALVLPESRLRSLMELVGLSDLFPRFDDEISALEHLSFDTAFFHGMRHAEAVIYGIPA